MRNSFAALIVSLSLATPFFSSGADSSWTGASDSFWTNALNWSPALPAPGDNVTFIDAPIQLVDLGADQSIGTLLFNAGSAYALTNFTLSLGGDVTQNGIGTVDIWSALNLGAVTRTFTGTGSGEFTMRGIVSGTGGAIFSGGNYTLNNTANTFSGGTTISGGRLTLGTAAGALNIAAAPANSPIGQGAITINGGTLRLTSAAGNISGLARPVVWGPQGGVLEFGGMAGVPGSAGLTPSSFVNNGGTAVLKVGTNPGNWTREFVLNNLSGTGIFRAELTNGGYIQLPANYNGSFVLSGQPGGDAGANSFANTVGRVTIASSTTVPITVTGGISFENAIQLSVTGGGRVLDTDLTVNSGTLGLQGRGTGTATFADHMLTLGNAANNRTLRIKDGATAQFDLQYRTDQPFIGGIINNMTNVIEAGGTIRVTRSQFTNTTATAIGLTNIYFNRPIVASGTDVKESIIDLLVGAPVGSPGRTGVVFNAGADLVVNGTGLGGLRVQGPGANVMNLATSARLANVTGTGGTLTLAISDNSSQTISSSPTIGSTISLGLDKHNAGTPTFNLGVAPNDLGNWGGLVVKGGTVVVGTSQSFVGNGSTPTTLRQTGGTLNLNGQTLTFSGGANVSGGIITGAGTLNAALVVGNGAHIAPGNSPGTLTVGDLTLSTGAILDYELSDPAGANDLINAGNLVLDGTLNITDIGGFTDGTYRLINYTGALTDQGLDLGTVPGGHDYALDVSTPNQINLLVSPVPEPGTLALFAVGAAALSLRAFRRRRS